MIGIIFYYGIEVIMVTIRGRSVIFTKDGVQATIEGMKLSRSGVEREFPDLIGDPDWKSKAVQRFKEKLIECGSEEKIKDYLIEELKKYGYVAKYLQRGGHRVECLK